MNIIGEDDEIDIPSIMEVKFQLVHHSQFNFNW